MGSCVSLRPCTRLPEVNSKEAICADEVIFVHALSIVLIIRLLSCFSPSVSVMHLMIYDLLVVTILGRLVHLKALFSPIPM